jgi:hypothetical protein
LKIVGDGTRCLLTLAPSKVPTAFRVAVAGPVEENEAEPDLAEASSEP